MEAVSLVKENIERKTCVYQRRNCKARVKYEPAVRKYGGSLYHYSFIVARLARLKSINPTSEISPEPGDVFRVWLNSWLIVLL